MTAYFRAMRLERWPRSMAIVLGSAAFVFLERSAAWAAFGPAGLAWRLAAAFLLTWGISTANYVVNEIVDLPFDVHHPSKRSRPLVLGEIRKLPFAALGIVLAVVCLAAAFVLFGRAFFLSLLALLAAGFVYNVPPVRTKDIPFLDSISESANNPIRFLIGWYAFAPWQAFPPVSLLLSWWAFGNFLMVAKRLSELRFLREKAGDYRSSQRRYTRSSLVAGLAISVLICLLTFVDFAAVYDAQTLYFITPFLAVFFGLIFRKTLNEAEVMEEPEKLLARPKYALYILFLALLFVLAFLRDGAGR